MSEEKPVTRLLKANNVQRRWFLKRAEELITRGKSKSVADLNHKKAVIYNQAVEKAMGGDLAKLLDVRMKIQAHKQEIRKLQGDGVADIKRRLNKRGIKTSDEYRYNSSSNCALSFYTDPPAVDEKSQDVCEVIVGNPLVQLRLMDCHNNKPYAAYEDAIEPLIVNAQVFQDAGDKLRQDIWAVVSTDDITDAMDKFRKDWV